MSADSVVILPENLEECWPKRLILHPPSLSGSVQKEIDFSKCLPTGAMFMGGRVPTIPQPAWAWAGPIPAPPAEIKKAAQAVPSKTSA